MSPSEFAVQLRACADGSLAIEDFEEWFASASWNVHQQGDQNLTDAVFRAEALYSAFAEGRLSDSAFRIEVDRLASAVYPFAENRSGDSRLLPSPESSAIIETNRAFAA